MHMMMQRDKLLSLPVYCHVHWNLYAVYSNDNKSQFRCEGGTDDQRGVI